MDIESAKNLLLKTMSEGKWVQRAPDGNSVNVDGQQYDGVMVEALESLYQEGAIVQVPSAGQALTGICFRSADALQSV